MFAGLAAGQQPPRPRTIELTIIATGKDDAPVQDLKETEITIKDDNKKQEIVSFEKISGGAPAEPGKPAVNNFVLIDCLNTPFSDTPENRLGMLKILNELTKADNVTILMLREQLKIVSDPSQGEGSALAKFAKQGFDPTKAAAFNWVFTDENALNQVFAPALMNERAKTEAWIKALQIIASNMRGRPGRRNLLWIGQYFPPLIMGESGAGFIESQAGANTQGGQSGAQKTSTTDLSGTARKEAADLLKNYAKDIEATARALQGAGVAIYPLDARYLSRDTASVSDKSRMQDMAKTTGGLSFASAKDVAGAVHDAVKDAQTFYVARYLMSDNMFNDKDHALKIETSRKDVKLRMRTGYFAPKAAK
jgi:VWFA-related protein